MLIPLPDSISIEKYGSKLNVISYTDASFLFGTLGNTQCCGSACVVVTEIYPNLFFDILRATRASVLHIVESATWATYGLPKYEKGINDNLGGAAHIKIFPQEKGWLVLVHIDDEDLYAENFL